MGAAVVTAALFLSALRAEGNVNSRRMGNQLRSFLILLELHLSSLPAPEALPAGSKKIRAGQCGHSALIGGTALFHHPIEWRVSFGTALPARIFFERESGAREK